MSNLHKGQEKLTDAYIGLLSDTEGQIWNKKKGGWGGALFNGRPKPVGTFYGADARLLALANIPGGRIFFAVAQME